MSARSSAFTHEYTQYIQYYWCNFYSWIWQKYFFLFTVLESFFAGGKLVSIEDQHEADFLLEHAELLSDIESSFWIGLYKNVEGAVSYLKHCYLSYHIWLLFTYYITLTIMQNYQILIATCVPTGKISIHFLYLRYNRKSLKVSPKWGDISLIIITGRDFPTGWC